MTRPICTAICVILSLVGSSRADVVVPNGAVGVDGDGTFSLTSTGAAGRTFQMTIAAGQLTGLVGQQLTGLQWRQNGGGSAAWPPVDANFASWDIFLGPGVSPALMGTTFANNFTGSPTQVRNGPLTFPAGSFTFGSSPNAFGPVLNFTTPYVYSGGDLAIEMRFAQQTGATTQSPLDAYLASGGPGNGWGVDFSARWTANSAGTTGGNGNFLVTNLVATPIPEPTSLAFAGVSCAMAAVWNKLRRRDRG